MDTPIKHPFVAIAIFLGIGFLLNYYGIMEGTLLMGCLLMGILFYKLITARWL